MFVTSPRSSCSRQTGFSIMEVILVLLVVLLLGAGGWFVYAKQHKNDATPNQQVSVLSAYQQCAQTEGHIVTQSEYHYGTSQAPKKGSLNICHTPDGLYVAETDNKAIGSITASSASEFSEVTDAGLKKAVLSSKTFTAAGCEKDGALDDKYIVFGPYISDHFAWAQPGNCSSPTGGYAALLLAKIGDRWQVIEDLNASNSGYFQCDIIDQYDVPYIFILQTGNSYCATSTAGVWKDLVSGVAF